MFFVAVAGDDDDDGDDGDDVEEEEEEEEDGVLATCDGESADDDEGEEKEAEEKEEEAGRDEEKEGEGEEEGGEGERSNLLPKIRENEEAYEGLYPPTWMDIKVHTSETRVYLCGTKNRNVRVFDACALC